METQAWSPPSDEAILASNSTSTPPSASTVRTPAPIARNLMQELDAATPPKTSLPKPDLPNVPTWQEAVEKDASNVSAKTPPPEPEPEASKEGEVEQFDVSNFEAMA